MTNQNIARPHISVIIPTFKRQESLLRTVESIARSEYNDLEITIVDMAGLDNATLCSLETIQAEAGVNIRTLDAEHMYVSAAINLALSHVTGSLILLSSDDVLLERDTIRYLVDVLSKDRTIGIISPVCCYLKHKTRIWWAGSKFDMWTGRTLFYGVNTFLPNAKTFDSDTFTTLALVRKELFYDKHRQKPFFSDPSEFPMHYEEVDFSFRSRKRGWRICVFTGAKVFHDIPAPEDSDLLRAFGVHTPTRAYFSSRNKILFHRKYSGVLQFLVFLLMFGVLFTPYYSNLILRKSTGPFADRWRIFMGYVRGFVDGLAWKPRKRYVNARESTLTPDRRRSIGRDFRECS